MEIIKVITKKEIMQFLELPAKLYKNDKEYIRHLDSDIENIFNVHKNKFFRFGEAVRWNLKSEDKIIGRIAAFYHTENKDKEFSGIGFFECIDNQEAANRLFQTAVDWLKGKGLSSVQAPINFGDRDSFWGLMVEGFKNPSYKENYNFPYYQHLFENFGFIKDFEQTTSKLIRDDFNLERFSKLSQRVFNNPKYNFKHLKKSQQDQFAYDFVDIYNKAWQSHDFFRPMSFEQVSNLMSTMMPIAPEKLNWFVYADDKPVGFFINVLDINSFFKTANGKFGLIKKLKFLLNRSKINTIRGIVFGVVPEYQNLGLEVGLIMQTYNQLQMPEFKHINQIELAWVGDFNPKMLSMFESMGAKLSKKHFTYMLEF